VPAQESGNKATQDATLTFTQHSFSSIVSNQNICRCDVKVEIPPLHVVSHTHGKEDATSQVLTYPNSDILNQLLRPLPNQFIVSHFTPSVLDMWAVY